MTVVPQVSGGILSDIIIWVRRLLKAASTQAISDANIADYVNRFVNYDLPERVQLFEFKRQYTFETVPNQFEYQAPFVPAVTNLFPTAGGVPSIKPPFIANPNTNTPQPVTQVPVYQTFRAPVYCDGVQMGYYQSNDQFYRVFPELVLNEFPLQGDGTTGPYNTTVGQSPILNAYIDDLGYLTPYVFITAPNIVGEQQYIVDSGYTNGAGLGLLIQTDSTFQNIIGAPLVGDPPSSGGCGTVNYSTGQLSFTFNSDVPAGANIETQTSPFSPGFPRIMLFFNNTFKLYPVPSRAYKIQIDAYITPSVYFNTSGANAFAYMSEYIALGAARKILSDTGDYDQYQFYEPRFQEQENLVLRRTSRQNATQRTPTIYSAQNTQDPYLYTQY